MHNQSELGIGQLISKVGYLLFESLSKFLGPHAKVLPIATIAFNDTVWSLLAIKKLTTDET